MSAVDEKDDAGEKAAVGVRQICVAALAAPGASPAVRRFAQAVLGEIEAAAAGGNVAAHAPRELEGVVALVNRQLDAVLDAANASHGARERSSRRVHMARALERAGLVLMDERELAEMVLRDLG